MIVSAASRSYLLSVNFLSALRVDPNHHSLGPEVGIKLSPKLKTLLLRRNPSSGIALLGSTDCPVGNGIHDWMGAIASELSVFPDTEQLASGSLSGGTDSGPVDEPSSGLRALKALGCRGADDFSA